MTSSGIASFYSVSKFLRKSVSFPGKKTHRNRACRRPYGCDFSPFHYLRAVSRAPPVSFGMEQLAISWSSSLVPKVWEKLWGHLRRTITSSYTWWFQFLFLNICLKVTWYNLDRDSSIARRLFFVFPFLLNCSKIARIENRFRGLLSQHTVQILKSNTLQGLRVVFTQE